MEQGKAENQAADPDAEEEEEREGTVETDVMFAGARPGQQVDRGVPGDPGAPVEESGQTKPPGYPTGEDDGLEPFPEREPDENDTNERNQELHREPPELMGMKSRDGMKYSVMVRMFARNEA
jgi:hypothetical protein